MVVVSVVVVGGGVGGAVYVDGVDGDAAMGGVTVAVKGADSSVVL